MKWLALVAGGVLLCLAPVQGNPQNPEAKARITKNEAEHIALKRFPGARVTSARLETVQGKLVWSLELAKGGGRGGRGGRGGEKTRHVAVDATTGRIEGPGKRP